MFLSRLVIYIFVRYKEEDVLFVSYSLFSTQCKSLSLWVDEPSCTRGNQDSFETDNRGARQKWGVGGERI